MKKFLIVEMIKVPYILTHLFLLRHLVAGIDQHDKILIIESERSVFSNHNGLEFEGFEEFVQSDLKNGKITFTNVDYSDYTISVSHSDVDKSGLVIIQSESLSAAGKLCYAKNYIVFRPIANFFQHFTAHVAHVRSLAYDEHVTVEWDFFFSHLHDFSGSFVSAFAPDNDKPDMINEINPRFRRNSNKASISKIFKGIGRCQQGGEIMPHEVGRGTVLDQNSVVMNVLYLLQVHCLPNYFEETMKLFDKNFVSSPHGQGIQVDFNRFHPLLERRFLIEKDWIDLSSAIFLHTFTHAYLEERHKVKNVSQSVNILTIMSAKIMTLANTKPLKQHFIKIVSTLLTVLEAASQYFMNEMDSLTGCLSCSAAEVQNTSNIKTIANIIHFLQCQILKISKVLVK